MADAQMRNRKMAPAADQELLRKIDGALAAEGMGRKLWYWPAGPRDRLQASAVIVETDGFVRSVTLAVLADELGCDRSDGETATWQAASLSPFLLN
jgi:hypothetical protein